MIQGSSPETWTRVFRSAHKNKKPLERLRDTSVIPEDFITSIWRVIRNTTILLGMIMVSLFIFFCLCLFILVIVFYNVIMYIFLYALTNAL